MLLFKKKFLAAIRSREKTQTVRIWRACRMRAGQRSYIPGVGYIRITAVDHAPLAELTEEDARLDGFSSRADLVAEIERIYPQGLSDGARPYRIRFEVFDEATQRRMRGERSSPPKPPARESRLRRERPEDTDDATHALVYWRDYRRNWERRHDADRRWHWHSNARILAELTAGDRVWFVAPGAAVERMPRHAGFLVAIWEVQMVTPNPDDDLAYPAADYAHRLVANPDASYLLDEPIGIDALLRRPESDTRLHIGRVLQGPRRLRREVVERLMALMRDTLKPCAAGSAHPASTLREY